MAELRKVDILHIRSMTWKWHTAYYSFIFHSNDEYTNSAESSLCFVTRHCQWIIASSIQLPPYARPSFIQTVSALKVQKNRTENYSNQFIYRWVVDWCSLPFLEGCFGILAVCLVVWRLSVQFEFFSWLDYMGNGARDALVQETYIRRWCVDRAKMDPAREGLTFRWYEDRALRSHDISTWKLAGHLATQYTELSLSHHRHVIIIVVILLSLNLFLFGWF